MITAASIGSKGDAVGMSRIGVIRASEANGPTVMSCRSEVRAARVAST